MPLPSSQVISGLLNGASIANIDLLNPDPADWYVVSAGTSTQVIRPDTVERFEYRNVTRISDYPVEQGAFASYNAVQTPYDIRMRMVCSGLNLVQKGVNALGVSSILGVDINEPMGREAFLATLKSMLSSLDLYDIVTPEETYQNCKLVKYDYSRQARRGVKLLVVDCMFQEVRLTSTAQYSTSGIFTNSASTSATGTTNNGRVVASNYIGKLSSLGSIQ